MSVLDAAATPLTAANVAGSCHVYFVTARKRARDCECVGGALFSIYDLPSPQKDLR